MIEEKQITYQDRIDKLIETKIQYTALKMKQRWYFDIDDHSCIPWTKPIPLKVKPNHPSGGRYGAKCIGENFKA
ncbi:MAG: hypothetical protein ACPL7B_03685 [Candidatus Poribacteria bacterium]